jgi:hypothetical protein
MYEENQKNSYFLDFLTYLKRFIKFTLLGYLFCILGLYTTFALLNVLSISLNDTVFISKIGTPEVDMRAFPKSSTNDIYAVGGIEHWKYAVIRIKQLYIALTPWTNVPFFTKLLLIKIALISCFFTYRSRKIKASYYKQLGIYVISVFVVTYISGVIIMAYLPLSFHATTKTDIYPLGGCKDECVDLIRY